MSPGIATGLSRSGPWTLLYTATTANSTLASIFCRSVRSAGVASLSPSTVLYLFVNAVNAVAVCVVDANTSLTAPTAVLFSVLNALFLDASGDAGICVLAAVEVASASNWRSSRSVPVTCAMV